MRAVVRVEQAGDDARVADVAQRILARLRAQLGDLIGPAGLDVLVARAVVLARRGHPVLAGVGVEPGGAFTGLDAVGDEAALQAAALSIFAHVFELLSVLIGEDLTMRLVRDVWPIAVEEEGQ